MRLSVQRGTWIAAVALLVLAALVASQRVHSFGMEGPGLWVGGLVLWAVLVAAPVLLFAAILRRRLPRVSVTLSIVLSVVVAVSLTLDMTGLGWVMDLLS
jgi:hypothetical protein